jgi:iron complex outermembrane receptor protein
VAGCGSPFVRLISPVANNAYLLGENTNSTTTEGFRLSALWKISDTWDFLLQQNYQDMHTTGYYYSYPLDPHGNALATNQITAFTPAYSKDKYESTAWTFTGQIGDVKAVYTGSYMSRDIDGSQDYSNYVRSNVGSYYGCIGPGAGYFNTKLSSTNKPKFAALVGTPLSCYSPVGNWRDIVNNTHQSHEIRVSTNENYRLRVLVGAFWEKFVINDNMNFNYLAIPQCDPTNLSKAQSGGPVCLSAVGPVPGSWATNPALRENMNNAFGEDDQRGYKQTAEFASLDLDIVPKVLILTGGIRHYDYKEFEHGSEWYTESTSPLLINHPNGACTNGGACGFPINLDKSESGNRYRGDLTWHITPDVMTYYTYSTGFRPGGFNRTKSTIQGVVTLKGEAPFTKGGSDQQYLKPAGYDSDNLINHEVGFKSEFAQHHVLFNATAYYMKWEKIQLSLFDPVHLGNTTFDVNGPSYTIKGAEVQMVARITEGFSIQGSGAWNRNEQSDAPCLSSAGVTKGTPNNPTPAGQCVTQVNGVGYTNPYGVLGTRPAFSPPYMWNLRARYEWNSGAMRPFIQAGANTIAAYSNEPASFPDGNSPTQNPPTTTLLRYEIPAYTTYDAALGLSKDKWMLQVTGSNITNKQTPTNISSGQFIKSEIPIRPRVLMFQAYYTY